MWSKLILDNDYNKDLPNSFELNSDFMDKIIRITHNITTNGSQCVTIKDINNLVIDDKDKVKAIQEINTHDSKYTPFSLLYTFFVEIDICCHQFTQNIPLIIHEINRYYNETPRNEYYIINVVLLITAYINMSEMSYQYIYSNTDEDHPFTIASTLIYESNTNGIRYINLMLTDDTDTTITLRKPLSEVLYI